MKTADCMEVWDLIAYEVKQYLPEEVYNRLCDAFCTFECGWKEHCDETHSDQTFPPRREGDKR